MQQPLKAFDIAVRGHSLIDANRVVECHRVFGFGAIFLGSFCRVAFHAAEGVIRMVRKIKAMLVLRLRAEGLTGRQMAAQGVSRTSVAMALDADREGIGWDD